MTYTFKVGDKGKTDKGHTYEVVYVGDRSLVCEMDRHHQLQVIDRVSLRTSWLAERLLPPEQEVSVWIAWRLLDGGGDWYNCGCAFDTKQQAIDCLGEEGPSLILQQVTRTFPRGQA